MAHPYKSHADKSGKTKMSSMHRDGIKTVKNLDMQGSYKHVDQSSAHMQHMKQSAAPGMAKGGHVGKRGGHKHKSPIAGGATMAPPSPEDMAAMQAGAGAPSPTPAPAPPPGAPPGMPMQKRGGAVKRADGGRVHMTAGAFNGEGKLQKMKAYGMKPNKKGD